MLRPRSGVVSLMKKMSEIKNTYAQLTADNKFKILLLAQNDVKTHAQIRSLTFADLRGLMIKADSLAEL